MRQNVFCFAALMAALVTVPVVAGTRYAESTGPTQVKLELSLVDGSVLYGSPCDSSSHLKLNASFGALTIPWETLQTFVVQDNGEKILVNWANGDKVTGAAGTNGVDLQTVFGKITVPLSVIKSGKVQVIPAKDAILPIDVKASGTYAPRHKLEYAYDGNKGTSWSAGGWSGWIEFDLGEPVEIAKIEVYLQFAPTGHATHEIYVSDKPMLGNPKSGTLVEGFSGTFSAHSVLTTNCQPGTIGRYVQVRSPGGRAWFNIRELKIYPR